MFLTTEQDSLIKDMLLLFLLLLLLLLLLIIAKLRNYNLFIILGARVFTHINRFTDIIYIYISISFSINVFASAKSIGIGIENGEMKGGEGRVHFSSQHTQQMQWM